MKRNHTAWDTLLIAAIVLVGGVCAQSSQSALAEENDELNGPIVQIAPDRGDDLAVEIRADESDPPEPTYWIGVRGRGIESAVLRTHLQLAENMGIVVEEIVPESPAAKAGLRKHDIVLRANGEAVHDMTVLQELVQSGKGALLELNVIRLGKEETVVVAPETRPDRIARLNNEVPQGLGGNDPLQQFMEQLQGGLGMRRIGPGIVMGGEQLGFNTMPNDVSVSVERLDNQPPKVTIRRGDQTWEVTGDDPESLRELPADLRPFVQQMLGGKAGALQWRMGGGLPGRDLELEDILPRGLRRLPGGMEQVPDRMEQKLEQLQQQIDELQRRLQADPDLGDVQ